MYVNIRNFYGVNKCEMLNDINDRRKWRKNKFLHHELRCLRHTRYLDHVCSVQYKGNKYKINTVIK